MNVKSSYCRMPPKADYWKYFTVQGLLALCQIEGCPKLAWFSVWLILHPVSFLKKSGRNFSKNPGKNPGKNKISWFCRPFVIKSMLRALFCRLASGSITLWTCAKPQKSGQNHKNPGVIRAIFPKCPDIRARPDISGRVSHTASPPPRNIVTKNTSVESFFEISGPR